MAFTDSDRRRFFLATTLTLLALPALWWVNRAENSTAPNVAVAGADVGVGDGRAGASESTTAEVRSSTPPSPPSGASTPAPQNATEESREPVAPVFLEGPGAQADAGPAEIAVPAPPDFERITTTATFRSSVGPGVCKIPGVLNGRTVTVVNLETGRSVTCTSSLAPGELADQITLGTSLFAELADLTDAPIPVEIRR